MTLNVINSPNQRAQTSKLAQKAAIFCLLPFRKKATQKAEITLGLKDRK